MPLFGQSDRNRSELVLMTLYARTCTVDWKLSRVRSMARCETMSQCSDAGTPVHPPTAPQRAATRVEWIGRVSAKRIAFQLCGTGRWDSRLPDTIRWCSLG
ncbi:hypothetical protein BAUCODRAFT_123243 [Baudoinia panamericana UAMH 10762]|uniref:Uncharacterized protein n=1 Tax=Baudoinia panamericana (strain UAMH 10762) TaxID=717646 RepID=M2LNN4_BAUPA|nr:uncharacterized protein BAUCODRAFT_123243 [Baudoinia panamericana UAMH 10762]EMC95962.1 hypothetical protein BAUCODRAFT_123243 [Baudoinia panamericana UAMH 10762]